MTSSHRLPIAHLVLDIGGVLFPPALPALIADLAAVAGCDAADLERHVRAHLARDLWSGRLDVPTFWADLTRRAGVRDDPTPLLDALAAGRRTPLPAAARVPTWARRVRVGILSNQRHEWAVPLLRVAGWEPLLDPVLISSATGRVKPDPGAFLPLTRLAPCAQGVLYVDDRAAALEVARSLGLRTLLATPDGGWTRAVDAALGCPTAPEPADG